jgi:hypothetical protein
MLSRSDRRGDGTGLLIWCIGFEHVVWRALRLLVVVRRLILFLVAFLVEVLALNTNFENLRSGLREVRGSFQADCAAQFRRSFVTGATAYRSAEYGSPKPKVIMLSYLLRRYRHDST